jgi:hypothetical protein
MNDPNGLRMAKLGLAGAALCTAIAVADDSPAPAQAARLYAESTQLVSQITPNTQPAMDPAVRGLIVQLGSTSPAAREGAMTKLAAMGKEILPTLRPLADAPDPELRARIRALIRRAERRLPPAAPPSDQRFHRQSVRVSSINGRKTVDVNDNGYRIHIEEDHKGSTTASDIKMSVTGVEEGKEITETYEAKDADELKRDNPEAFDLYERWNGTGPRTLRNGAAVGIPFPGRPLPAGPGGAPVLGDDAIDQIGAALREQVQSGNLPADEQQKILDHLNDAERIRREVHERLKQRMDDLDQQLKGTDEPNRSADAPPLNREAPANGPPDRPLPSDLN